MGGLKVIGGVTLKRILRPQLFAFPFSSRLGWAASFPNLLLPWCTVPPPQSSKDPKAVGLSDIGLDTLKHWTQIRVFFISWFYRAFCYSHGELTNAGIKQSQTGKVASSAPLPVTEVRMPFCLGEISSVFLFTAQSEAGWVAFKPGHDRDSVSFIEFWFDSINSVRLYCSQG